MVSYSSLWKAIIRPPREVYSAAELGPNLFTIDHPLSPLFHREDIQLEGPRGTLHTSFFKPHEAVRDEIMPCVVVLHGNASSRLEVFASLEFLLPLSVTVATLDMSGSGLSDGDYVTLGHHEVEDVRTFVRYLTTARRVEEIVLFGRSMGSVVALNLAPDLPAVKGVIADSPFSNFKVLAEELSVPFLGRRMPRWVTNMLMGLLRKTIEDRAGFNVFSVGADHACDRARCPVLMIFAKNDTFIDGSHSMRLFERYAHKIGSQIRCVEGDHNSNRDSGTMRAMQSFIRSCVRTGRPFSSEEIHTSALLMAELASLSMDSLGTAPGDERMSYRDTGRAPMWPLADEFE